MNTGTTNCQNCAAPLAAARCGSRLECGFCGSFQSLPTPFVAHGLINPEDPKVAEHLRYWVKEQGFQGMRFSPIYHPKSTWLNCHSGSVLAV